MAGELLAPELRRFVLAKIDSVPMLEALLLLRSRAGGWTPRELAERLYLAEPRVDALLRALCRAGLARSEAGQVHYAPGPPHVAATVDELASVYSRHVVRVTELIHSRVDRKAHDFADAFNLRRDE